MGHDMWLIESTCVVGEMLNYSYVTPMTVQPQLDVLKCKSSAELLEACEEDHNDCSAWCASDYFSLNFMIHLNFE